MINRKSSILSILFAMVMVGFLGWQLPNLTFDYELENFFPIGDPDLEYYNKFVKKFGNDNDYILIGLQGQKGIFDTAFLQSTDRLIVELKDLKGTTDVISLLSLKKVVKSPMGYIEFPYLHIESQSRLKNDSISIESEPMCRESFISKDGKSMKLVLLHQRFSAKETSEGFVASLDTLLRKYPFEKFHLAGKAVAQKAYIVAVEKDFSVFLFGAIAMILVMLIFFVRKAPLIFTALIISGGSLVATIGLMVLIGKKFDLLSALIPSILLVVSMSDIIHLFSKTREEINKGGYTTQAINCAIKEVGLATLLTSLTTALGFLTLVTINVKPIIDLGIYAAVGIIIAFLVTYLLFPPMLFFTKSSLIQTRNDQFFKPLLLRIFGWVLHKKTNILIGFGLTLGFVGLGISYLYVDAFLIDDLPKNDPVKVDFQYFDNQYAGTKPFSVSIWPKDTTTGFYHPEIIYEINKIETIAREVLNAGSLISVVTYVKSINQSLHSGLTKYYSLPENEIDWKKAFDAIRKLDPQRKFIKVVVGQEGQITGFTRDKGSRDANRRKEIFYQRIAAEVDENIIGYRVTGTSPLIEKSHELLSKNLFKGLALAILLVSIIAGIMFRSVRMILITLIPNLYPIMATAAVMGYAGIPINLGTSIIFAISFGIVVDDTIHFLNKFKSEKARGMSHLYAIKRTLLSTGEPIIITTIILTSGFLIFCFSQFGATFYTGLFVSISFVVALLAVLTLLPVMILLFFPDKERRN